MGVRGHFLTLFTVSLLITSCQSATPITQQTSKVVKETQATALVQHSHEHSLPSDTETVSASSVKKAIIKDIPILMYHSISKNPKNLLCVDPDQFALQMEQLAKHHYNAITFQDLLDWKNGKPIPVKPIVITFDDGYKDNYTAAYPILKKWGLKGVIFLPSEYIGSRHSLTIEQINEMLDSGTIEVGSHTLTHADVTHLSDKQLREQIVTSKEQLERMFGITVYSFAYPYGKFDAKSISMIEQSGYDFAVTTRPGLASKDQGLFELHRVRVPGDMQIQIFRQVFP